MTRDRPTTRVCECATVIAAYESASALRDFGGDLGGDTLRQVFVRAGVEESWLAPGPWHQLLRLWRRRPDPSTAQAAIERICSG